MKNRQDIKAFITDLETSFPVDSWTIDGAHIWPIIRTQMFLHLVESIEPYSSSKKDFSVPLTAQKNTLLNKIKSTNRYKRFRAKKYLNSLRQADLLFSSAFIYRSNFKDKSYDKFADPIFDQVQYSGLLIEHSPSHVFDKEKAYKKERVFYLTDALDFVLKSNKRNQRVSLPHSFELANYNDFILKLQREELLTSYLPRIKGEAELGKLMTRFQDFAELYIELLKRVKPKMVFSICYYSFPVFALNYAAKKLGIRTIEIQHGPQTQEHLSYASWTKIPKNGFNIMPQTFWTWDKHSDQLIDQWTSKTSCHDHLIGGNPWIQFHSLDQSNEKDTILYSLQNQTLEHLFSDDIVHLIKEIKEYKWLLRLHPRQAESKEEFEIFLKEKGILHLIEYEQATSLPLPSLLARTKLHITNFSGCTLEAAEFQVPTILIDQRGVGAFSELIDEGKAIFCADYKSLLTNTKKLLTTEQKKSAIKRYDYNEIISELIKE